MWVTYFVPHPESDLALADQTINLEALSSTLYQDLKVMQQYFISWHLHPNQTKTTVTDFNLSNRLITNKLQVSFGDKPVKNEPFPKYFGVATLNATSNRGFSSYRLSQFWCVCVRVCMRVCVPLSPKPFVFSLSVIYFVFFCFLSYSALSVFCCNKPFVHKNLQMVIWGTGPRH